jgi:hypothetical protein
VPTEKGLARKNDCEGKGTTNERGVTFEEIPITIGNCVAQSNAAPIAKNPRFEGAFIYCIKSLFYFYATYCFVFINELDFEGNSRSS